MNMEMHAAFLHVSFTSLGVFLEVGLLDQTADEFSVESPPY